MSADNFDTLSIEASKKVNAKALVVISNMLDDEEALTMTDALRAYEATNRRLGLALSEKADNKPTISLTINGCNLQLDVKQPTPADTVEVIEDATTAAQPQKPAATSISFAGLKPIDL